MQNLHFLTPDSFQFFIAKIDIVELHNKFLYILSSESTQNKFLYTLCKETTHNRLLHTLSTESTHNRFLYNLCRESSQNKFLYTLCTERTQRCVVFGHMFDMCSILSFLYQMGINRQSCRGKPRYMIPGGPSLKE